MSFIVGLTGPSGAGKSMASEIAEKNGFFVINCDIIARKAVEPETAGLAALVAAFGSEILDSSGRLNRKKLAAEAFSSPEKTELLNKTLLPHITALIEPELSREYVLLDAPTLYESGLDGKCDITVAVLADTQKRTERIIERDGLTLNEARLRIAAGKPDSFYLERADKILYNNGDSASFLKEAERLFEIITEGVSK